MAAVAGASAVLLCSLLCYVVSLTQSQKIIRYSNSWAVEVTGGKDKADEIAKRHGFINLGAVSMFLLTLTIIIITDWLIK